MVKLFNHFEKSIFDLFLLLFFFSVLLEFGPRALHMPDNCSATEPLSTILHLISSETMSFFVA